VAHDRAYARGPTLQGLISEGQMVSWILRRCQSERAEVMRGASISRRGLLKGAGMGGLMEWGIAPAVIARVEPMKIVGIDVVTYRRDLHIGGDSGGSDGTEFFWVQLHMDAGSGVIIGGFYDSYDNFDGPLLDSTRCWFDGTGRRWYCGQVPGARGTLSRTEVAGEHAPSVCSRNRFDRNGRSEYRFQFGWK
jgi:hypothetical protein